MVTEVSGSLVRSRQRGVVLLAVLVFILLTTLAASSLVVAHVTQVQREREEQLLFIGAQYRSAIGSYYNTIPPGGGRSLPQTLDMLLNDHRFAKPIPHLRRLYPDPITGQADWQLVMENGGIVGIRSRSGKTTLKKTNFAKGLEKFEGKDVYSEWVFSIRYVSR